MAHPLYGRDSEDIYLMSNIITARDVYFSYEDEIQSPKNENLVLKGISLDIKQGEFLSILGHNGCGKSTLAKHFNAILTPLKGDVTVCGINTKDEDRLLEIRQNVGMVFQNPDNQIVAAVVEEDVAFALENMGVEPSEIRRRVDLALNTVNMYDYKEHAPYRLSGGQKQRVAIAGIIAMMPKVIVLDEPTAMLDPKGREEVLKTIKMLNHEHGITIVLITHYMNEAAMSDRVVVMDKGKVVMDDKPECVFSKVELMKSIGLDVPQVTELCYLLKKSGVDIKQDIINENECVDALLKILK